MRIGRGLVGIGIATVLAGCGPSAQLTEFACQAPCQDVHDPFLLKLTVGYDDPDGLLANGRLVVRLGENEVGSIALGPLVTPGQAKGRIPFELPVDLGKVRDELRFRLRAQATLPDGETNELELPLIVKL